MTTVIIDYNSGNLRSAAKSFERCAAATGHGEIIVSSDPDVVARAARIVLPGVGAFADCRAGLDSFDGLLNAIETRVITDGAPFLGICVGMQLMATRGREHGHNTPGFDWIGGEVVEFTPDNPDLKIPHMGWNVLEIDHPHPVLAGIDHGAHAYFVHSYHLEPDNSNHVVAHANYGGKITAVVARNNMIGTQFHPEKSQKTGLRLIENFLRWKP